MAIIERFNDIKSIIGQIRDEAVDQLPQEVMPDFTKNLDLLQEQLNKTVVVVEKYFQDENNIDEIKKDLLRQMDENPLYKDVPLEKRGAIAEKVISDPKVNILKEDDFKKFIVQRLRDLDEKELIVKAYSKEDIIKIGKAFVDPNASSGVKYSAGIQHLTEMTKTPQGFEDAVAAGEQNILKNPDECLKYLYDYYGV